MITIDDVWNWLASSGFARPKDGVMVDVTRHPGGCFQYTLEAGRLGAA